MTDQEYEEWIDLMVDEYVDRLMRAHKTFRSLASLVAGDPAKGISGGSVGRGEHVLARLSRGEFVITTDEARKHATMRAYNEGNDFRTNDASLEDIGK